MSVLNFATSPNSGVKFLGLFLRSEKTIFRLFLSGCASFSWFFFLQLRARVRSGRWTFLTHHRSTTVRDERRAMLRDMQVRYGVCGQFLLPSASFATHAGNTWVDRVLRARCA